MKTRAFWYTQTYNYTLTVIGYKQCFPFQSFDGRSADELTFKVPAQSCESTRGKRLDCRLLPLVFIGCNTCTCTRGNRAHISSGSNGGTHWLLLESKTWSKRKIHRPTETHTHHVNHLPHGFCSKSPRKPFYFICFLRRRRKPVFICIKTLDTQMAGLISALDSLFRFAFFPKFGYALSCPTVRGESVRDKKKEERIV